MLAVLAALWRMLSIKPKLYVHATLKKRCGAQWCVLPARLHSKLSRLTHSLTPDLTFRPCLHPYLS